MRKVRGMLATLAACAAFGAASAADFPAKPVRLILGSGPGSSIDIAATFVRASSVTELVVCGRHSRPLVAVDDGFHCIG